MVAQPQLVLVRRVHIGQAGAALVALDAGAHVLLGGVDDGSARAAPTAAGQTLTELPQKPVLGHLTQPAWRGGGGTVRL